MGLDANPNPNPNPNPQPIARANDARLLKIAVSVKGSKGPSKLELPTGGYQRVRRSKTNPQLLYVSIDLLDPVKATAAELANKEYMAPSAMVDNADEVTTPHPDR